MYTLVKILRIISVSLLLLTGVNALIAGAIFIIDPSGEKMGMSTTYLLHSPFSSFLIPGIILFIANGVLNVLTAILCMLNYKHYSTLILIQGIFLSGWIIIQVILVKDFNALHFTMLTIGIILSFIALLQKNIDTSS